MFFKHFWYKPVFSYVIHMFSILYGAPHVGLPFNKWVEQVPLKSHYSYPVVPRVEPLTYG
jgi:hypothetical protein